MTTGKFLSQIFPLTYKIISSMETYSIIKLIFLPNKKDVWVEFDNGTTLKFPLDLVLSLRLNKGAVFPKDKFNEIQKELSIYNVQKLAYSKATSSLKTRSQIRRILTQKGFPEDEIEIAINKLEKLNIIDDEKFAKAAFDYLTTKKLYGVNKIKQYLMQKGVPRNIIEKVISRESEQVNQSELITSYYNRSIQKIRRKPLQHRIPYCLRMFRNAGFSSNTINDFLKIYKPQILEL